MSDKSCCSLNKSLRARGSNSIVFFRSIYILIQMYNYTTWIILNCTMWINKSIIKVR